MTRGFLPNTDVALNAWSRNFRLKIEADPQAVGISVEEAEAYALLDDEWSAAFRAANEPITRTRGAVQAKNDIRVRLKQAARRLGKLADAHGDLSDTQRVQLGLTVRAPRTRIGRPTYRPSLRVVSAENVSVRIKLYDTTIAGHNRKPDGVFGAFIFSHVGPTLPAPGEGWTFVKATTRTKTTIHFAPHLPPGTKVWIYAVWCNAKLQPGDAGPALSTHLPGGGVVNNTAFGRAA